MKEVLKHPLGPLPWSLANGYGTMKKSNKAALARELEKKVAPVENITSPSACIRDGMSLLHKVHGENCTFAELSGQLFANVIKTAGNSQRIDVVFDVYKDMSMQSTERIQRGSAEGVAFANIMPGHRIKQWRRLLACASSKTKLVKFIGED